MSPQFNRDDIERMLNLSPRRVQLSTEWQCLHPPQNDNGDWSLVFPFKETLGLAFTRMCSVRHIGIRDGGGRAYTFIKEPARVDHVDSWIQSVGRFVALRDCLTLSFAIDYDRELGDPTRPRTKIGALRSRAKPYNESPNASHYQAAKDLAHELATTLRTLTCYEQIDGIISMPPSDPSKPFDLPAVIVSELSQIMSINHLRSAATTRATREQLKNSSLSKKLDILLNSVQIDAGVVAGKTILLIDDLYQSGASMNAVGMMLLSAGAEAVYGLACEKTCRNDDNRGRSNNG
jgi:hypothetical protein